MLVPLFVASVSATPRAHKPKKFDQKRYDACVAEFEANYDAWLPTDREAKDAIAKVKDKSAYIAVPALLYAYNQVDAKAAVRQTRKLPPGAVYAAATRLELATALVAISSATHARTCVDGQARVDAGASLFVPPLTGDRDRDKVRLCGGTGEDDQATSLEARRTAADAFNTANSELRARHAEGSTWAQVDAYSTSSKETVLSLLDLTGNRHCVKNGRTKLYADGSWGPDCDVEYLDPSVAGKAKAYHLAPRELPFQVKRGDRVVLAYELDPDAPAGREQAYRKGGWWYLWSLERDKKTVFGSCAIASAHEVEVQSTSGQLFVMSR